MTDIKLTFNPVYCEWGDIEFVVYNGTVSGAVGDFAKDEGFETAILMSLFTDARVNPEDSPDGTTGGCWSDRLDDEYNRDNGSKLWTLRRNRLDQPTLKLVEQYSVEALKWFVDDGIALDVLCAAKRAATLGWAESQLAIVKPDDSILLRKYTYPWAAQLGRA